VKSIKKKPGTEGVVNRRILTLVCLFRREAVGVRGGGGERGRSQRRGGGGRAMSSATGGLGWEFTSPLGNWLPERYDGSDFGVLLRKGNLLGL